MAASLNAFLLDPENSTVLAGKRQRLGLPPFLLLGTLLVSTLIGSLVLVTSVSSWRSDVVFERSGVSATGQVTELSVRRNDEDEIAGYAVTYRYRPASLPRATFTGRDLLSKASYERVKQGGPIDIRYLPSNVARSRLAEHGAENQSAGAWLLLIGWNVMSWGLLLRATAWVRRLWRLSRAPTWVSGELLSATADEVDYTYVLTVTYGFTSPRTGNRLRGKSSHDRHDLEGKPLPKRGTEVAVSYVDDETHSML